MRTVLRPDVRPRCVALIPAAGIGSRSGGAVAKQYLEVAGKPMIVRTIEAFAAVPAIERIVVVIAPDDAHFEHLALDDASARLIHVERAGGVTRDASVSNGLDRLLGEIDDDDWILVHDAARCGITPAMIATLIETLRDDDVGGLLALPVADTIKRAGRDGSGGRLGDRVGNRLGNIRDRASVLETIDRSSLWQAQTPQMFRYRMLRDALAAAQRRGLSITDEASAIEASGHCPRLVVGGARNFKVTTADDLAMMDALLRAELIALPTSPLKGEDFQSLR